MRQVARLKLIVCGFLLIYGVMGVSAFGNGEQRTLLDSITYTYARKLTIRRNAPINWRNATPSCTAPQPEDVRSCRQMAQQILSSTVRIEMDAWIGLPAGPEGSGQRAYRRLRGNGHATVKDGRYLITHNHFSEPLLACAGPAVIAFGKVSIYTADGEELHLQGQSVMLDHAGGRLETVVLDFGLVDGIGFFESADLPSAPFSSAQELPLEPGAEVAQVNWDGTTTYVQWATVESLTTQGGAPVLVLASGLEPGASGGGVFRNGVHVANNWTVVETFDPNRQEYGTQSTAAVTDEKLLTWPEIPSTSAETALAAKACRQ